METSHQQSLSIESFSYSWLVNLKPSYEGLGDSFRLSLDASDEAASSFIEMDPKLTPSKRFFTVNPQDFNSFDFPAASQSSPITIVHADELISNGLLMPLFLKPMKTTEPNRDGGDDDGSCLNSMPNTPIMTSSVAGKDLRSSAGRLHCSSLKRCSRISKRIFHKYLNFLRPLCEKLRGNHGFVSSFGRRSNRETRMQGSPKSWEVSSSPASSPRTSLGYSADNWRRSCDSECSIYEAVLHCKRTINGNRG